MVNWSRGEVNPGGDMLVELRNIYLGLVPLPWPDLEHREFPGLC